MRSLAGDVDLNLGRILLEEGCTLGEVGEQLGIAVPTVRGYQVKGLLPACIGKHGGADKWHHSPWKERLIEAQLLIDGGANLRTIASRFSVNPTTVGRWFKKGLLKPRPGNIPVREVGPRKRPRRLILAVRLATRLADEGVPTSEIATRVMVAPSTVVRWRQKGWISSDGVLRKGPGAREGAVGRTLIVEAQALLSERLCPKAVAVMVGVTSSTIRRWISEGVLVKPRS